MADRTSKSGNVVFLTNPEQGMADKEGRPVEMDGVTGPLIRRCREVAADTFPTMLGELFDALDDDLYKLAENSTNNTTQTTYFDAMRSLRVFRSGLEKSFIRSLLGNYDEFWRSRGQNPLIRSLLNKESNKGLSLVGEQELEEELATSTMIAKANNRFHRTLFALNKRFSAQLGGLPVSDEQNPLGPSTVANVFKKEMAAWDGDLVVRIVIYKLFDKHVVSQLKPVYVELNQLLMAAGVLPDIHTQQHGQPTAGTAYARSEAPTAPADTPQLAQDQQQGTPATETPGTAEIWALMQQMMSTQQLNDLSLFRSIGTESRSLPEMPRATLVDELSALQRLALRTPASQFADIKAMQEHLRKELVSRLGSEQGSARPQRLGDTDKQTIDLILMLFNEVLDDPNLPDAMRAMLARLQIPVLKAAIADPSFVENASHPARLLLNNLAKASLGWSDENNDRSRHSLYDKVKVAVDRILHEFDDDLSLFTTVNEEFTGFLEQSTRAAALMEKRVTQALEGEDRIEASRVRVEAVLQSCHPDELADVAWRLLDDPWRKLLTITMLREGGESRQWREAVETAGELVKSVLPGDAGAGREELLSLIPKLNSKLDAGLNYISFNRADGRKLLNELQACHISVLRTKQRQGAAQSNPPASAPTASKAAAADSPADTAVTTKAATEPSLPVAAGAGKHNSAVNPARPVDKRLPKEDKFDQLVASIDEGQWIRMLHKRQEIVGKLVWRSRYTGTMLFVDGQGNKVAQINRKELAELFRIGASDILENPETPIMDRAVNRMMKSLQDRIVRTRLDS